MPLIVPSSASAITSEHSGLTETGSSFIDFLAGVLDDEFQKAVPTPMIVDISPPAGSLKFPLNPGKQMAKIIGVECAAYWSMAIAPGPGMVGGSNDAAKIASPIEAGLLGLAGGGYLTPHYSDFVDVIYKEVLTIQWVMFDSRGKPNSAVVT